MSKPLKANPKRAWEAAKYHRDVINEWGRWCYLCGLPGKELDAAHVIPRSKLGPLRYADVQFARPAHRMCHNEQEMGNIDFAPQVKRAAIEAHNKIAKVPIKVQW